MIINKRGEQHMKKRILAIAAVTALQVSLLSCPALADGVQPGDRFRFGR